MMKLQEIYKLCYGFENINKNAGIKRLMSKGYSKNDALRFYNIWRRHYLETCIDDLTLSGICIEIGKERKSIEECSFNERQQYLEALNKEQLIKIIQAMVK